MCTIKSTFYTKKIYLRTGGVQCAVYKQQGQRKQCSTGPATEGWKRVIQSHHINKKNKNNQENTGPANTGPAGAALGALNNMESKDHIEIHVDNLC